MTHRQRLVWMRVAVVVATTLTGFVRSARAEFFAPPLPPSTYYEVGYYGVGNGITFGPGQGADGAGIRVHERNGLFTKLVVMMCGGFFSPPNPSDTVSWTETETQHAYGHLANSTDTHDHLIVIETSTTYTRPKTAKEREADQRMIDEFYHDLNYVLSLHLSTEIILLPDRDDGKLHGGSFEITASFGGRYWWIDTGIAADRYAARVKDTMSDTTVERRYRNLGIPVRLTVSPVAWLAAEAEIHANALALVYGDTYADHSTLWRAGLTLGLPYLEMVYGRVGLQGVSFSTDRPLGVYLELGARF
jgi:hypothetical protein